jgi:hypothetical protein
VPKFKSFRAPGSASARIRKIAATSAKLAEARFRATFENAAVGIAPVVPDGSATAAGRRLALASPSGAANGQAPHFEPNPKTPEIFPCAGLSLSRIQNIFLVEPYRGAVTIQCKTSRTTHPKLGACSVEPPTDKSARVRPRQQPGPDIVWETEDGALS